MPKKTLRIPYEVPSPHKCRNCGVRVRQRDILSGLAKKLGTESFICPYCLLNQEAPPHQEEPPLQEESKKLESPLTTTPAVIDQLPMLKEFKGVRQIPGEVLRRWYTNGHVDLIVWLDEFRVLGFQLIIPSENNQTAITWHEGSSISVTEVDDGESRPWRMKMTPILQYQQSIDPDAVLQTFRDISRDLPSSLKALIEQKLSEIKKHTIT